jgi:hypothetical protein
LVKLDRVWWSINSLSKGSAMSNKEFLDAVSRAQVEVCKACAFKNDCNFGEACTLEPGIIDFNSTGEVIDHIHPGAHCKYLGCGLWNCGVTDSN